MDYKHIISLLIFLCFHILLANCTNTYPSICTQTPYPELCNSLINSTIAHETTLLDDENHFDIRDISLKATLAQSQNTHKLISQIDTSSFTKLHNSAWNDCIELYEDSIYQLNRSIHSKNSFDSQTWLSASIANQKACQNGFIDFNLSSYLKSFSMLSTNFSKYLSNSLAINNAMASSSSHALYMNYKKNGNRRRLLGHDDHLPIWVSNGDRKLLQISDVSIKADIIVAQDGSGNYKTIAEALVAAKKLRRGYKRFVIYVKKGIYKENVEVKKSMKNLMLIGDGIDATIVTGNKNVQDGSTTFRSATFGVSGDGFIARGMTFENTAGPAKHQAVALRSSSDFSIFYKCSFKGYQDTLYVHSHRQFYRDCDIYGTVDFIFGDAVTVIQNCNIYIRKPMQNQKNTVTAQGRSDPNENTGIIIQNSYVTSALDLRGSESSYKSYLGRPWHKYSTTVYIKCRIDDLIDREGWLAWNGNFGLSTLYYGEYMNIGRGANTIARVKWPGFHVIMSEREVEKFALGNFLDGDAWIQAARVPFTSSV